MTETHYERCAAPGCLKKPRPRSRYCEAHYAKLRRTLDLRGRVLRKNELKWCRELALQFVQTRTKNPAVAAALQYMAELIEPSDKAGFLRGEFDRLRIRGATPETMLASVIALYLWVEERGYWSPGGLRIFNDRCFDLNLGRALLGTVPAQTRYSRTGKVQYVRVKARHAEALGQNLRLSLGLFSRAAALTIQKEILKHTPEDTGRVLLEALKKAPF